MELKKLDFRKVLATVFFFVSTFCFVQGFKVADATSYEISAEMSVPSIGLVSDVTTVSLRDNTLRVPETIVGSFSRYDTKTLLIGHASTVFGALKNINIGDEIIYDDGAYIANKIEILEKTSINMDVLLEPAKVKTIVLMTCAGELYNNGDASHRLIITAISE